MEQNCIWYIKIMRVAAGKLNGNQMGENLVHKAFSLMSTTYGKAA